MALKHRLKATKGTSYGQVPGNPAIRRMPQYAYSPVNVQPPPGSYDPSLDAALGRTQRGYGDLLADYAPADGSQGTPGRLTQRAQDDYNLGVDRITGKAGTYTRSLSDLLRDRARATEDFQRQRDTANLGATRQLDDTSRSFSNLKAQQSDVLNATGQSEGGAALQATEKRTANQGLIDTRTHENLARALGLIDTNAGRFGADSAQAETRLGENRDMSIGDLGLGYQRGVDDSTTTLARAGRENTFFGQDTQAQKIGQAKAGGWVAPRRPGNEHTDARGSYRIVRVRGRQVKIRPDGTVERI